MSIGNDVTATGNLSLATTNSPVNQTAGAIVSGVSGGTTTVTAGTGTVTLAQPLNDFDSINVVSGSVVNINDSNALTAAANASGNLTITSTGPLSSGGTLSGANIALTGSAGINLGHNVNTIGTLQLTTANAAINQTAGAITVGNLTTASAGSGDITLNQAGNDFSDIAGISASGGAVRLRDANALVIASLVNGANKDLSLTAGTTITGLAGDIDTGSADLAITSGAGFTTFGTLRGTNVTLGGGIGGVSIGHNVTALGNLTLNATDTPISQTRRNHHRRRHDDGFGGHRQHQPDAGGQRLRHARRHRQHGHGARRQRPRARTGHHDHADARHQRSATARSRRRARVSSAARRRSTPAPARWR